MLTSIVAFLGTTAFRFLWGEISSILTKWQDHTLEIERMKLQDELDEKVHRRKLENLKAANDFHIRELEVMRESASEAADDEAFKALINASIKSSGFRWIDFWNQSIRPQFAQLALFLWLLSISSNGWVLKSFDVELIAGILGFFIADRSLAKRGK